jgi:hypothetical protein
MKEVVIKRILTEIAAVLLLITGTGAARAEEGAKPSMGIKTWLNKWTQHAPSAESITSNSIMLLGPAIEMKLGDHIYVEASYVFSVSDYTFSNSNIVHNGRQDADLVFTYMPVPEFGILVGYKNISINRKEAGIKETVVGPLVGISGNIFVAKALSCYAELNYLVTRFKQAGATTPETSLEEDIPGWAFEFGIKYAYTKKFTGTLGYKYETYTGKDSHVEDTFSGPTLGGMIAF